MSGSVPFSSLSLSLFFSWLLAGELDRVYLAGYAHRSAPCDRTLHPLWTKALALWAAADQLPVLLLTADLVGVAADLSHLVKVLDVANLVAVRSMPCCAGARGRTAAWSWLRAGAHHRVAHAQCTCAGTRTRQAAPSHALAGQRN